VVLDYEAFVTAYSYPLDLFHSQTLPRLQNVSAPALSIIRRDLYDLITREDRFPETTNWQKVADMIVSRYASQLQYLASGKLPTSTRFGEQVDRILNPFIDYDSRNMTSENQRCAAQFFPLAYEDSLAARTISHIAYLICSTLSSAALEEDYGAATQRIIDLIQYLNWTTWKECRGCDSDQICFVPMWPAGSVEDYDRPSCIMVKDLPSRRGYWDGPIP
jgi:hypothetical protein